MLSQEFIRNLSHQASRVFPAAASVQKDIEGRLYELLQSSFDRLNLVTREEFDTQRAVLERAYRTIGELEQKVDELEREIARQKGEK